MKTLKLLFLFVMFGCTAGAQNVTPKNSPPVTFYVENGTTIGSPVITQLTALGCTVTYCKDKATYIIGEEIEKPLRDVRVKLFIYNTLNNKVQAISGWHWHLFNTYSAVEYAAQKELSTMLLKLWL